jgi:uncharacterized membrane protein
MTSSRGTRASDADRERIAAALGDHYAAGRLTLEEFRERLDQAYAAKTLGELDDLMTDLPRTDLAQLKGQHGSNPLAPERRGPGTVQAPAGGPPATIRQFMPGFVIAIFVIWLIGGAVGVPWLWWIVIPLALIMLRRWSIGAKHRARDHQDRRPFAG